MRAVGIIRFAFALASVAVPFTAPMSYAAEKPAAREPLVEFEMMTWAEVKSALADGKTTALIFTGGTEQRGPHLANGGHNLMSRAMAKAIALKLGNAIVLPVLPYTPNNASAVLPGTIGITGDLLGALLERLSEQAIATGFKNVVLMSDHGGGQPIVYQSVAKKLDDKYAPQGMHVFYCDEVYGKANDAIAKHIADLGLPAGAHAGLLDTSMMMYLDTGGWVRKELVPTAVGDLVVNGKVEVKPDSPHNGIAGDGRKATVKLGKEAFDIKVDIAVKQIQSFIPKPN